VNSRGRRSLDDAQLAAAQGEDVSSARRWNPDLPESRPGFVWSGAQRRLVRRVKPTILTASRVS
jgi:hypothetical protein